MGLNSSDNIFADPEALQAYSDQLKRSLPPADKVKVIHAPARRRQLELQFYMFSKDVYQFIGKAGNSAAIVSVVLGALYEAYFRNFKCNPVRLTSCGLKQRGLSRYQKLRALRLLAKAGFITIHQKPGKNPLVTLNWLPTK